MNYNDALRYIGSRLRFGIKPGLDRIRGLLCRLGQPQQRLKFIHVAGTNGKGSICTMTAASLIAAGYKTGLYTSPYICDFRERMQINGEMIPQGELARLTQKVSKLVEDAEETTEFELITCIAMLWFAEQKCDYVVLETGLGGRLDATNVIDAPLCAAITRIDFDHTAVLGNTLSEIAAEKAGILKKGSKVVISPEQPQEALDVLLKKCAEIGAQAIIPERSDVSVKNEDVFGTKITYKGEQLHIPLVGKHQISNAITAVEILRSIGVEEEFIRDGISKAYIPARMELLSSDPVVILDGAHNPNGAQALAAAIKTLFPEQLEQKNIVAIMGVLKDKDYQTELKMLAPLFSRIFCTDGFSDRCEKVSTFTDKVKEYTDALSCESPENAVAKAVEYVKQMNGVLIICGSLYLAGYIRQFTLDTLAQYKS